MGIIIDNHTDGDILSYSLALIYGKIDSYAVDGEIEVWTEGVEYDLSLHWPVLDGAFKAAVQLKLGHNKINIVFNETNRCSINLIYRQLQMQYIVRPVYIVCHDDDGGYFQGPNIEDCSLESACKRIQLGAQLIQSLTAEKLWEHSFDRKTFHIETDEAGNPICHIFKSNLLLRDAYKMAGNELWSYFGKELMTSSQFSNKSKCKWYCFMSFTRYEPPMNTSPKTHTDVLMYTKGHTALGGGGLALFGTGNLHTWASSIRELIARFTDCRKIDRTQFMDDSAYRQYYWANYATGLGASLHELGHTFDLAHTNSGIMSRGFDDLHKVFLVQRTKLQYQPTGSYIRPPPLMVAIETGFRPSLLSSIVIVRNANSNPSSPVLPRSSSPNIPRRRGSSCSTGSNTSTDSNTTSRFYSLPQSQDYLCNRLHHRSRCGQFAVASLNGSDDMVHWHRASAVLLNYHKWFNIISHERCEQQPTINGCKMLAICGLRLIQLRSDPDGTVFHHWEFLENDPPTEFTLHVSRMRHLPLTVVSITVLIEDNCGNILKTRLKITNLRS